MSVSINVSLSLSVSVRLCHIYNSVSQLILVTTCKLTSEVLIHAHVMTCLLSALNVWGACGCIPQATEGVTKLPGLTHPPGISAKPLVSLHVFVD